jgi:hypothetical protein
MAIHPITFQKFSNKRFIRIKSYDFASKEAIVALVAHELPKAALSMPIGFIEAGESFSPVAVLGLQPGKNLFVRLDGSWLGAYIPAAVRGFPFLLGNVEDGRQILCINDALGSVSETEGEAFFEVDQQLTQAVKDILNFLSHVALNHVVTEKMMVTLQKHQLIIPWEIKLHDSTKQIHAVQGLHRVDEKALNQLGPEALQVLQQVGALQLIYCQLLSMQHLHTLEKLGQAHQEAEQMAAVPKTEIDELDLTFRADDTTISFENL